MNNSVEYDKKVVNEGDIQYETGVVLFKIHDLRLRDHEAIFQANVCCRQVVYLFVVEDE